MKNRLLLIIMLLVFGIRVEAQNPREYIIVTIESVNKSGVHKFQTDNWIFALDDYKKINEENILYPLYLSGFSATDYNECCKNNDLILFNSTTEESFVFEKELLTSKETLISIIKDKRKKIQTIQKKWVSGKKNTVNIYLTPVIGTFCFCKVSHASDDSKLDYAGQIGVPQSGFSHNPKIWDSKLGKGMQTYDFSLLPFVGLDTIQ